MKVKARRVVRKSFIFERWGFFVVVMGLEMILFVIIFDEISGSIYNEG